MSANPATLNHLMESHRPSVFMCYSRSDVEFVTTLDANLRDANIDVSLDLRFQVTPDYRSELFERILSADTFLFVISPRSVESAHCNEELRYAVDHNKRLLAVMHKDGFDKTLLPPAVNNPEWVFMRTQLDLAERLPILISAIKTDFELMQMHTRLLVRADEWEKSGFNKYFLLRGTLLEGAQTWLPKASANVEQLPNPTELQTNYILASQRARSSFVRKAAIGAFSVAAFVILLGVVALIQAQQKTSALSAREEALQIAQKANVEKETAVKEREMALQSEQTAIKGREEEVKKREKAQEQEKIALADKTAALGRERTALLAKAQAEIDKKKADYKAELEGLRAEHEKIVRKANRTVLVGERLVETDPTKAVAFGIASKTFSPEWSAQTMIRRAAVQLPAFQDLRVEQREISNRPEVLPSNFVGVQSMYFAHQGNVLVVHHLDGTVTIWNLQTGALGGRIARLGMKIIRVAITHTFPTSLFVLFDDGTAEQHRLPYSGTPSLQRSLRGDYIDLLSAEEGSQIILLQRNGQLKALSPNSTKSVDLPPLKIKFESCTIDRQGKLFACASREGEVTKYDLSTGIETSLSTQKALSVTNQSIYSKPGQRVTIRIAEAAGAIIVSAAKDYSLHIEVFDITSGLSVWRADREYARFAVDSKGSKVAILAGSTIEQFQIVRDQQEIALKEDGKWNIDPVQNDVGEPQAILYGPYGKYLLTASAPILTLVGPPPGTVKLWYSNPIDDPRAGDPYRGKLIGQQSRAVLNIAFDEAGKRIATFSTDGHVRLWDIFPEQSISTASKAQDYFAGFYHTPMTTRQLLAAEFESPEEAISAAEALFKVRLDGDEFKKLNEALDAQESTDSILNRLVEYTPPSIALQSRGGREEPSDLYLSVPSGFDRSTGEYDPLVGNLPLQELVEDITKRGLKDSSEITNRYLGALGEDYLLLSGLQSNSMKERLMSRDSSTRAAACVVLALSGDLNNLDDMRRQMDIESDSDVRPVMAWAIEFLKNTGRDLNLSGKTASKPGKQWMLLGVPTTVLDNLNFQELLTIPADEELGRILFSRLANMQTQPPISLLIAANRFTPTTGIMRQLNLVYMLRDHKAYDAALAWCAPLLGKAEPKSRESGQAENAYGYILELKGEREEAMGYYQRSIEAGRLDGWPERNWADILRDLGREKEAKEKYKIALQRVITLVDNAKQNMNPDKFRELYEALKPEVAGFYNALAWHIVTSHEVTTADLTSALELSIRASDLTRNSDPNILDTLAHAYAALKEYTKAIETERRAILLLSPSEKDLRARYQEQVEAWTKKLNQ
jgi:WD40 repeat protein/tetratricopeptide (TPR) repeat protein